MVVLHNAKEVAELLQLDLETFRRKLSATLGVAIRPHSLEENKFVIKGRWTPELLQQAIIKEGLVPTK